MEQTTLQTLVLTAGFIGCVHTVTGPDHFVPFIAMARVGDWSLRRTVAITSACGVGHVLSSIALGSLGIGLGWGLTHLVWFESFRGGLAAWLLVGFGIAYTAWGLRHAARGRRHAHLHTHADGTVHLHEHAHREEHTHVHADQQVSGRMTPWILFTIFVFGPCEPLIPLLMYPAARLSAEGVLLVVLVFGATTLATMLGIVVSAYLGLASFSFPRLERHSHTMAGAAITACGVAISLGL